MHELDFELELIQTRMIQKPLLWAKVGKSSCVLVGICELRLSLAARYDPHYPSIFDFLSGCLVRVPWTCLSSTGPARDVEQVTPYHRAFLFLIKTTVTIATRVLSCGRRAGSVRTSCYTVTKRKECNVFLIRVILFKAVCLFGPRLYQGRNT